MTLLPASASSSPMRPPSLRLAWRGRWTRVTLLQVSWWTWMPCWGLSHCSRHSSGGMAGMGTSILGGGCLSSEGQGKVSRVGSLCAAYPQPTNLCISQAGGTATAGSLEASILHSPESGWDRAQLPSQGDRRLAPSLVR